MPHVMSDPTIPRIIKTLQERMLPGGGFTANDHGRYRTDATAWAILALVAAGCPADLINLSRARLIEDQQSDGRVCVSPDHPEAFWPTPLAILAWCRSSAQQEAQSRAVHFLLSTTGIHAPRTQDGIFGHDPSVKGWPWIEGTSSWVGSSGIAIMALQAAGYGHHERVAEAARMIMDRQLPAGGWNYGNTTVFGVELRPMPADTGIALNALQHHADRSALQHSLDYLKAAVVTVRTPRSLGWSLLGLGAWGECPERKQDHDIFMFRAAGTLRDL